MFRSEGTTTTTAPRKPPPVESKLSCTLEELYSGSTRKPGWKKGTKITFPDKGNEQPNQQPADLIFMIDEKPHNVYKRDGNDLMIHHRVTMAEALGGTTASIDTLDGRTLSVPVTDIVSPGYELVVAREGMPIAKEPGNRGDLIIKFEVKFPTKLTMEQRAGLKCFLGG
ncbi:unnamed protein product [Linum tenue]|uniref:Chaperone DnaJ C-terminal domain-containing protein n=1 Tax=Linum tenue TaxID=586396 RepID=A0AAV0K7U7_9ROSI|nr:unnamed protein product [Linum tenue]